MAQIPLVGPTYQSKSVAAECQRTINWYPEAIESQMGKSGAAAVLYPTPGLRQIPSTALPGVWRRNGLLAMPYQADASFQGTVGFGVCGTQFVQLNPIWGGPNPAVPVGIAIGVRGQVRDDGQPVRMAHSGIAGNKLQVVLCSGGAAYLYDLGTGVLTGLTLAVSPVISVFYMDGVFFAVSPTKFQISDDNFRPGHVGAATWDPSAVANRSEGADPIVTGLQNHREVWLPGEHTTEVWYNTGGSDTPPFAPIPGVFVELGCAAAHSFTRVDQSVAWLAKTRDGDRIAVLLTQYEPQRISTHAIENTWRSYARVDDAVGWTYQQDGHTFWMLAFPTAKATWVYDSATQLWHERSYWNPRTAEHEEHRAACGMRAWNLTIVGDRASSTLYALDPEIAWDDVPEFRNSPIRRVRRCPHLSSENRNQFFAELQAELETGLGRPVGAMQGASSTGFPVGGPVGQDPQLMLRWSDDRAHTWSSEWWRSGHRMGTYGARVRWHRLGASRDRVFELSVSDPIPWRLTGAYVEAKGA